MVLVLQTVMNASMSDTFINQISVLYTEWARITIVLGDLYKEVEKELNDWEISDTTR